ncbi:Flp family type IVb pilin [Paraburkholderia sp. BL17N1]|uniref:Flp family type IVb pilin n=1 Tax=Paraburkholderia sp. BL17N1 TaxID=1938798 RepID=UPI000EAC866D|nr:Flp family type IVb pilin [Paraburkholderia sp. BL17N1]RKR36440.1 pilus assembly protein Flp/PilA [Paraburkholderia sp. BL17N1]
MKNTIKKFLREEDGVAAIEYALLAGLIAVAIIVTVQNMTTNLKAMFTAIGTALTSAAA